MLQTFLNFQKQFTLVYIPEVKVSSHAGLWPPNSCVLSSAQKLLEAVNGKNSHPLDVMQHQV